MMFCVSLFKILKGDALKGLHLICQQIWKTQQWPQDWQRSVFIPIPKKGNAKGCSNSIPLCSLYMLARLCSTSFKLRFSSRWIKNVKMCKLGFKNIEEPEIKLSTFAGSWRNQGISRKTSTSALLTMLKALTMWITTNCGKFFKRWEYQTSLRASWETWMMQVKKQQLELHLKQQTGSKLRKEYIKAVYCHPVYWVYMQSISFEMLGWMTDKLESRLLGKIPTASDMQMIPL